MSDWRDDGMVWHRPRRGCDSAGPDISNGTPEFRAWAAWMRQQASEPQAKPEPQATMSPADWLKSILAEGPKPSTEVIALARARGIGRKGLLRAQKRLGIKPTQSGRAWFWALPGQSDD
jgi:hypothetical protein